MVGREDTSILEGLLSRRRKLEESIASSGGDRHLEDLLEEVLAAIERLDKGTYGICEVCEEPIETARLAANPFVRVCLAHLDPDQQQALEEDLAVASRIQTGLLPEQDLRTLGWDSGYHYRAAGPVSGDYCDLLSHGDALHFIVGDVSGKGISAAMLMTHLHATFRALVSQSLPLDQIMERANRMFCESTLPSHFATLVLGKAERSGAFSLCIAGHPPVLINRGSAIERIDATGLPLGMFCDESFSVTNGELSGGDSLVLYTDGLSESRNVTGDEYGIDRLVNLLQRSKGRSPRELIASCLEDLESFQFEKTPDDDLTLMVIRRLPHLATDG